MKFKIKSLRSKKAQEEMFGFAFVILLVSVIGITFLLLSLRGPKQPAERENFRVNDLLNAVSYYTTTCEKRNVQELLVACYDEALICGEHGPCRFVENELKGILESSLQGDYFFKAEFRNSEQKKLIELKRGECPGRRTAYAASSILPAGEGNIIIVDLVSCPLPLAT